jgi:flagellin
MFILSKSQASANFAGNALSGNKKSIHSHIRKLSYGSRIVTSLDDAGLLSVQMKMKSHSQIQSCLARNITSGISFLEMQDSALNTAQKILVRMSELKCISAQNPMKSEQDIDSYNNEFHDLQLQLYQLSQQEFNGISLFATTTESIGGDEVVFRGNDLEDHSIEVAGNMNNTTISIFKLPFLAALTIKENDSDLPVTTKSVGTGFDSSGNEIPVGQIDSNWTLSGQATTPRRVNRNGAWAPGTATAKWLGFSSSSPGTYIYATSFDLSGYDISSVNISGKIAVDNSGSVWINGNQLLDSSLLGLGFQKLTHFNLGSTQLKGVLSNGTNSLEIHVENHGSNNNPTGFLFDELNISVPRSGTFELNTKYSDRLNNDIKVKSLGVESQISLSNIDTVPSSYFQQAIENLSFLRTETSASLSRLNYAHESIQSFGTRLENATHRITEVDYAYENASIAKKNILTSTTTAMIAQANTMDDVVLTMLN